ncbi:hypothetical protein DXM26_20530 [Agrobacterium tumefaciens]|uniref:DUF6074 family protein n=1 Tax=Agrobacterium tumefaciens TaxID=358 RepID=UPI00123004EB|nr:hypothetical protein DXM26_20530 [Agrobacterium tumefaciens]
MHSDLPLFSWQPVCIVISFPLARRMGKVRDVAAKMLDKTTERHAEQYRSQVTEALQKQMSRSGVDRALQSAEIEAFWAKVQEEMVRLTYQRRGRSPNPRGAA